MRKLILFILFGLSTISLFSENNIVAKNLKYNTNYWTGEIKMNEGRYEEAISYFKKCNEIYPQFHKPYYQLGVCYAQLEDYKSAYNYFVKMIGTDCSYNISSNSTRDFEHSEYYIKMIKEQDSLLNAAKNKFDTNFSKLLSDFIEKRIGVRNWIIEDTMITRELIDLCVAYGEFPSYLNVGTEIYRNTINIISLNLTNMSDETYYEKVLHFIKEGIEKEGIEVEFYAFIEDLIQSHYNRPQKYGTLIRFNYVKRKYPSISELNENRRLIGLHKIELDAELFNIDLEKIIK